MGSSIAMLGQPTGSAAAVAASASLDVVADLDDCVSHVVASKAQGDPVRLVAISTAHPHPLAAARRIRGVDSAVGIALLVRRGELETTRANIAFAADITGAVVLADDLVPDALRAGLEQAAEASYKRSSLDRALRKMNDQLLRSSPLQEAPEPLSVSESYLAALTRSVPEAIISVDTRAQVVTANPAAVRMLQVAADDLEGRRFLEIIRADTARLREMLEVAQGGHVEAANDIEARLPDGTTALLSVTAAPVFGYEGQVFGIVIIARDVTEERRTEERLRELQRAESLATLAGGVAHDFNNLLVTVQGWAELACADPVDTALTTTAFSHILDASRQAAELARSMLAYSGRTSFEPQGTDLSMLVADISTLLQASISRKVELRLDLAPDLPLAQADPTQLRQVLMNLVVNAAEAIGNGSGRVTIRTALRVLDAEQGNAEFGADLDAGPWLVLEVEDTGHGMHPETVARVFDPFFTTKFAGRGLGLAASHGIVRAHGGGIAVHSRPDSGTRFRVALPVAEDVRP